MTGFESEEAASGYAALGNPARLHLFRFLVRAGHGGAPVGTVQEHLGIPLSTLAHHIAMLVKAGLVTQERRGRQVICRASFERMERLIAYLTENCCAGVAASEDCECEPATEELQEETSA